MANAAVKTITVISIIKAMIAIISKKAIQIYIAAIMTNIAITNIKAYSTISDI